MKLSDKLRGYDPHGKLSPSPRFFSDLSETEITGGARALLLSQADALLEEPVPLLPAHLYAAFHLNGDRSGYEQPYFQRRMLLMMHGLALRVTGDEKYFEPMLDALWAILEETTWVLPAHQRVSIAVNPERFPWVTLPRYDGADTDNLDLFSAATGADLALIYHWHGGRLEQYASGLAGRIERMLRERILHPLMCVDDLFWMRGSNNWTPWIVSNVYTVLLALGLTAEEREAAVARTLPMLANFVDTYHDDGGCDEGPSYWDKAGASLFDCLEELYDLTGGGFDVFGDPMLCRMGEYVAKAYISGSYYLNFADAPGVIQSDGSLIARFGRRTGSKTLEDFGRSLLPKLTCRGVDKRASSFGGGAISSHTAPYRMVKNLLDRPEPLDRAPLFGEVWLDGLQVMAVREFPEQSDRGLFFACKGGCNAENHNHNDVGSFLVYQDGQPLLPDLGVGTYTKFTFRPETRYKIFSMQSSYHNLMEIGGHMQLPGGEYRAETVSQGDGMLSLELRDACPPEAKVEGWVRTMGLRNHEIRVEDRFTLGEAQEVCWNMVTFERPEQRGDRFVFRKAEILFDPSLRARIEEHVFEDDRFVNTWRVDRFYRLVLETPEKVSAGGYAVTIRAHG